jgi:hypothetical protein
MATPPVRKPQTTWPRVLTGLALPAAVGLLAACATHTAQPQGPRDATPARASYLAYAGPPVDHFTWLDRYMGWEAVSDDELILFLSPTKAYYLKVWSPCGDRGGLRWVYAVDVPKTGGAVYAGFDSVVTGHWRCPISEIRPVDWGRMKADARAARKAQQAAGAAPAAAASPPSAGSPHPGGGPPPDASPPPNPQ